MNSPSNLGDRTFSKRFWIIVILLGVVASTPIIVAARKLFESPMLDGEAFLVMQSRDVKKLADLKVYLLRDPSAALATVKKTVADQYVQTRETATQSDSTARAIKAQIDGLKEKSIKLESEKQKDLAEVVRVLDEILKQCGDKLANLKTEKVDVETAIRALERLKDTRSEIKTQNVTVSKQNKSSLLSTESALQNYVAAACAAAAKLINDYIIAQHLTVALMPKDGRFPEDFSADTYKGEIFQAKKPTLLELGQNPDWLGIALPEPLEDVGKDCIVFPKFPTSLTDKSLREAFIAQYSAYVKRRFALEIAMADAENTLRIAVDKGRVMLQKFDDQYGTQIESQLNSLKINLETLNVNVRILEAFLLKSSDEKIAILRSEIEQDFAARQSKVEIAIASAETELKPIIAHVLASKSILLRYTSEGKTAAAIASNTVAVGMTDGNGRFVFSLPLSGEYVVYAELQTGHEENLFWLEQVKVEHKKATVRLSNSNSHSGTLGGELADNGIAAATAMFIGAY